MWVADGSRICIWLLTWSKIDSHKCSFSEYRELMYLRERESEASRLMSVTVSVWKKDNFQFFTAFYGVGFENDVPRKEKIDPCMTGLTEDEKVRIEVISADLQNRASIKNDKNSSDLNIAEENSSMRNLLPNEKKKRVCSWHWRSFQHKNSHLRRMFTNLKILKQPLHSTASPVVKQRKETFSFYSTKHFSIAGKNSD